MTGLAHTTIRRACLQSDHAKVSAWKIGERRYFVD
jgi:hypothetical protein